MRAGRAIAGALGTAGLVLPLLAVGSGAAAAPSVRLTVAAGTTELTADGRAATTLVVSATNGRGRPLQNGKRVRLAASLGTVAGDGLVLSGTTTFTFTAGTWPGTAALTSPDGWAVSGDTAVELVPGEPVATTLHLHGSFSEGNGTMRGHAAEADAAGIDLVWWTDHDFLYYPDHDQEVTAFDFETGNLSFEMPFWGELGHTEVGWHAEEETFAGLVSAVVPGAARTGGYGWKLKGTAAAGEEWGTHRAALRSSPMPVVTKPLQGEVSFRAFVRPHVAASADGELWIDLKLSHGQDNLPRVLHFVHSAIDYAAQDTPTDVHYPIDAAAGAWTEVHADVSGLARERFPDIGDDAHLHLAEVAVRGRLGEALYYDLDDFEWSQDLVGDDLRDVQRAFLDSLPFRPTHLVGAEIGTDLSRHINAFGSAVPLVPYSGRAGWTTADLVDQVHAYGGITSYNHMFGVGWNAADTLERAEMVVGAIDLLLGEDAFGCDLIEVGYRQREGLLADFLEVWDALSTSGLVITGIGAMDLHNQADWASFDNRFVTWIGSASAGEDDLLWNLDRGAAWFGDPTLFLDGRAEASLSCDTSLAGMGQVVEGAAGPQDVRFAASPLAAGWQVRLVEDGVATQTWTTLADGGFSATTTVDPAGGNVVRFEVVTADGTPALYTNPLYFYDTVDPAAVGDERRPAP